MSGDLEKGITANGEGIGGRAAYTCTAVTTALSVLTIEISGSNIMGKHWHGGKCSVLNLLGCDRGLARSDGRVDYAGAGHLTGSRKERGYRADSRESLR